MALFAAAFALALPAGAQNATAIIRGTVTTQDEVTPNANVTATNAATGFSVRTTSSASGAYVLQALVPGTYRVVVTAAGSTPTLQMITVRVGQDISLNLQMDGQQPISLAPVVVSGLRDNRTSEVGTNVTPPQIDTLPQTNRNFLTFADLAPGVVVRTNSNGDVQLYSGAQSSSAINVYIDGVSQKNYLTPGGITGQEASRGNPFPQSAIAEYRVVTQNYKAEYDQIASAAVIAASKGGTNEFHGEVFADRSANDWREATPAERASGHKASSKDEQYGLSLGGPIVLNKSHWFLAYEEHSVDTTSTVSPGAGYTAATLPAQYQPLLGAVDMPFKEHLLFGKIDWSVDDSNLLELSTKLRDENELTNVSDRNTLPWGTRKKTQETRLDLRWQHSTDTWVNDTRLTYEDASSTSKPASAATGIVLTTSDPTQTVLDAGGGRDFRDERQRGQALQNDFTFTGLEWSGSHIIKTGIKLKFIDVGIDARNPANPQYFYDLGESATTPYQVEFGAPLIEGGAARSRNTQLGLYVQDDWELNKNLTLNLGLRWDYERSPGYLNYVTPGEVVAALRAAPGINAPGSGVNIDDYISTGSNRSADTRAWQPRLGYSFDLNADQQHVLFGGYARAYDRNLFDSLQAERNRAAYGSYTYFFDTPDHPCVANCLTPDYADPSRLPSLVNPNGAGREIDLIDNKLKTPHSDQFSVGMRNRLGQWNTEVTLSHVESHDGFVFLLGNRRPDGSFFATDTIWNAPYGYPIPGYGSLLLGTNGLETRSNSVQFKVDKPYRSEAGWGVTFAYTYTRAKENREFERHDALEYPNISDYGWRQAGGVSRHRIVATGVVDAPLGLVASARLTLASHAPRYGTNCLGSPADSSGCVIDQIQPGGDRFVLGGPIWGYRQVDLAVSREFKVPGGTLRLRGDLINVFNTYNYDGYDTWWGINGVPNPNFGQPTSLAGPTRTFKLGLAYLF